MRRWLLLLVALLLLAGCGATKTLTVNKTVTVTTPGPAVVSGHPCVGVDYYMQCAATVPGAIPPSGLVPKPTVSGAGFGVDFAWGGPSCPTLKAYGGRFGVSYLSYSSKDWSGGLLSSYWHNGCGIVFVFETSAARSLDGFNAGYSDAFNATHEAAGLGLSGKGIHIDYASDYDTSNYGCAFCSYYQGAAAWDRRVGDSTGAYGGLHTIQTLCQNHITTANWQTIAWSYGQWASPSCAPLRQTSINDSWHGYSVDYDTAVAAYYGQSNFTPPPPPGPSKKQIAAWRGARTASLSAYHHSGCSMPVLGRASCATFAGRVLYFVTLLDKVQKQPVCWGARAQKGAAACQIARPQLSIWTHAASSSHGAWLSLGCFPAGPQLPITKGKRCGPPYQRWQYFKARAAALFRAWI
jgi:hypothetical protein